MLGQIRNPEHLIYPESDGKPMGENTLQVKWIVALFNGLQGLFRDRDDVFVAADLFWYPKQGDPTTVTAPDVMVLAFFVDQVQQLCCPLFQAALAKMEGKCYL